MHVHAVRSRDIPLRSGFTVLELLVVLAIAGIMMAFAYPRYRESMDGEAVLGARRELMSQLARARATAAQRGCRSELQFRASSALAYVTSCRTVGTGLDTIGEISQFGARYSVTMTSTADSLGFGPTSIGLGTGPITVSFMRGADTASVIISSVGRPRW